MKRFVFLLIFTFFTFSLRAEVCSRDGSLCEDDGNRCTVDQCTSGECRHTLISVDDGNPCTEDTCDSESGIHHTLLNACEPGKNPSAISNYDIYFCIANESEAMNLKGQKIELSSPCPELTKNQADQEDQRQVAETLIGVDPTSDHFAENVRPLMALTIQRWMMGEINRPLFALQTSVRGGKFHEISNADKTSLKDRFNKSFKVTSLEIENQGTHSIVLLENANALLLNFKQVSAQEGGCSLVIPHE